MRSCCAQRWRAVHEHAVPYAAEVPSRDRPRPGSYGAPRHKAVLAPPPARPRRALPAAPATTTS
eukprot:13093115-Alexandrium_andersonii.AAC.1